ncbi:S8 family serine peptidase [Streptomyces sp. NPDC091272]|uniref:S8 family serine peptidase n=1 Tax=Streptomyces sp. NPDC091272 TaxID=3365981 RepID=UPI00382E52BF
MTAGTSQPRRRRQRRQCVLAAAMVCSIGLAAAAPAAVAAEASPEQWYLGPMKAEEMWKVSTGKGIKVAVIDSGVHASTPSLKGQVLPGKHFTREGADTQTDDTNGQGTTTAELIAGTGKGGGIRGLAPGAKIIPFKVALHKHDALPEIMEDSLYQAVRAAADSDAQIINISVGSEWPIQLGRFGETDAFKYAASKGKLVFAGTGDNAKQGNKPQYPAKNLEVVGVSSTDRNGQVNNYSQHGDEVDLAAPGAEIPRWCDAKFERYCSGGGFVSAAALASASAALIWSKHPSWSANQVLRVMYDTAGRSWKTGSRSVYLGHGSIRPRAHLVDGKGDPGAPDRDFVAYEVEPNPPAATKPPAKSRSKDSPALASSSQDAGSGPSPLLIGGIVTAVLVLAAGAFAVVRKRRTT